MIGKGAVQETGVLGRVTYNVGVQSRAARRGAQPVSCRVQVEKGGWDEGERGHISDIVHHDAGGSPSLRIHLYTPHIMHRHPYTDIRQGGCESSRPVCLTQM